MERLPFAQAWRGVAGRRRCQHAGFEQASLGERTEEASESSQSRRGLFLSFIAYPAALASMLPVDVR